MHPIDPSRALFLDIDGVLHTGRSNRLNRGRPRPFDREAIAALNRILTTTGAQIVVSSSWRVNNSMPDELEPIAVLDEMLTLEGVAPGSVIGATPWLHDPDLVEFLPGKFMYPCRPRRDEIALWLSRHPEVTSWCAIDDDEEAGPDGLVLTDFEQGLTQEAADLAIDLLLRGAAQARGT